MSQKQKHIQTEFYTFYWAGGTQYQDVQIEVPFQVGRIKISPIMANIGEISSVFLMHSSIIDGFIGNMHSTKQASNDVEFKLQNPKLINGTYRFGTYVIQANQATPIVPYSTLARIISFSIEYHEA